MSQRAHAEDGFTLIEVLVVLVLTLVVSFGVLNTLDNFTRNADSQTRRTDANDLVRGTMDRVVADLRQVKAVEVAQPNDLVYTVVDSATATRRVRVCLGSANVLWRSVTTFATTPPAFTAGSVCPSAGAVRISRFPSTNSPTNPAFRYDNPLAASVRNVSVTFAIDSGRVGRPAVSTLRSSAFVRAQAESTKITDNSVKVTCNSAGPLLTLDSAVGPATVSYTDLQGMPIPGAAAGGGFQVNTPVGSTSTQTTVVANVTNPLGQVTQIVKTVLCSA